MQTTTPAEPVPPSASPQGTTLGYALFATRWLQAPLYFGLVAAQGVYVYKFFNELWTLIVKCVSGSATETYVMLAVLKLVDVVMIANLLIMTIVGGYETFVSRIGLQGHRDQPEWLSHVNSNVLKVKLATAIVGISSVHLLQMFVDVHHTSHHALLWGTMIHMAFIASAVLLAYMSGPMMREDKPHGSHGSQGGHGEPKGPQPPRRAEPLREPTTARDEQRSEGPRQWSEPTGAAGRSRFTQPVGYAESAGSPESDGLRTAGPYTSVPAHGGVSGSASVPAHGGAVPGAAVDFSARAAVPAHAEASAAPAPATAGHAAPAFAASTAPAFAALGHFAPALTALGHPAHAPLPAPLPIPAQATSYESYAAYERRGAAYGTRFARGGTRLVPYESGVESRVRAAGFPVRKVLEEFDEEHPHSFDRQLLARLGTLDFVGAARNVVFVGAPGTGKTHLAIGLGVRACQAGHRVLFATAEEWAARLAGARAEGRLAEELAVLDACPLLIVDEVGYLPFDSDTARLFFQLVARRYERGSLIVTSDRSLGRWDEIFGGAAPALVDRLAHHADIVHLEGDSYRLRRVT